MKVSSQHVISITIQLDDSEASVLAEALGRVLDLTMSLNGESREVVASLYDGIRGELRKHRQ